VIPREGVESEDLVAGLRLKAARVIPREGVERNSSSVAAIFLSSSDPERGS